MRILNVALAFTALAMGGCAGDHSTRPAANKAFVDMYDRPPARARKPLRSRTIEATATISSAPTAPELPLNSPEWWAAEKREDERIHRLMTICRGC